MTDSKTSARRIKAAERERQAVRMRLAGATYEDIASSLGISRTGAFKAVSRALAMVREKTSEDAEMLREIERQRLESLILAATPAAGKGDIMAIESVRRLSESLRKLLGLDAPARQDVTSSGERIVFEVHRRDMDE